MKKVSVLLAEGFEEIEAITPIDMLRRAEIDVTVTGVSGRQVTGAHGVSIETDAEIENINFSDFDCVVLPGGMPGAKNLANSEMTVDFFSKMFADGKLIAAICAAPAVVLGPNGILRDKKAVCYPGAESFSPDIEFSDERCVRDGNLITAQGPGTAAEFSYAVIEVLKGEKTAYEVKKHALFLF
ncbi:MAG: DJ-1/PfpI family protein [Spirochaetia bacterium]|nr:DJ-1/PfpI family protein [Spirochaetia bacterium]MCF7952458.1 DJ-1/PfpI family protein [Spirochaetales bacterium]